MLIFLDLCARSDEMLSPPPDVDKAWHAFLLHSRDYEAYCNERFGRVIHHQPTGEPDPDAYRRAYERRQRVLQRRRAPTRSCGRCRSWRAASDSVGSSAPSQSGEPDAPSRPGRLRRRGLRRLDRQHRLGTGGFATRVRAATPAARAAAAAPRAAAAAAAAEAACVTPRPHRPLDPRRPRAAQPAGARPAGRHRQLVRAPPGAPPRRRPRGVRDGLELRAQARQRAHDPRVPAHPPRRASGVDAALRPRRRRDARGRRDRGGRRRGPHRPEHGLPGAQGLQDRARARRCSTTPTRPWRSPRPRARAPACPSP